MNELLISDEQHLDSYITFDDALRNPWSCTKLIRLNLGISGCMLPVEFGVKPYYRRPTPITLTKVETQHFSRLENLYRQIGSLTALQELNLRMVSLGEDDPEYDMYLDDRRILRSNTSFLPCSVSGTPRQTDQDFYTTSQD